METKDVGISRLAVNVLLPEGENHTKIQRGSGGGANLDRAQYGRDTEVGSSGSFRAACD